MAQKKGARKPQAKRALLPKKTAKRYVSPKMSLEPVAQAFYRADLIFDGVDHSGATFEARVYLNNENANAQTPKTAQHGYAGSFHIFGHGGCFGDAGHCEIRGTPRAYDPRPAHPLTPARKVLIATEPIRQAVRRGKHMTVTVVPVVRAATAKCDVVNVLKFEKISVVTYG